MAKQMRRVCLEKEIECRDQNTSIDRISILPDELLVRILSFLSLKEATATSVFSRRWRYLWTFIPRLDFDGTESLLKIDLAKSEQQSVLNNEQLNLVKWVDLAVRERESVLDMERWNYVKWVDNVVALHKGSTIEEFRIDFNLNITHTESIDNWLRYALARKVQRLELNLTDELCMRSRTYDECYSFPYKLLRIDKRTFSNSSRSWSMRECDSIDCKYLRKVSMNFVNVNGEALEFLLSNCPLLEHLSVSQSGELTTMKITGPLPSLKCLEISLCHNLNSVEIRDANLVRLIYKGKRIHFLLENVPLLVEMFIDGMITGDLKEVLLMLSSYLLQLEIFSIFRVKNFSWEETEIFYSALKMSNLKELRVQLFVFDDDSLLSLTNLIRASPCLETFLLEVSRENPKFVKRKVKKIVSPYAHLREVKFVGYSGVTSDLELVMHFVENAALLEKLLVDTRDRMDEIDNDEMDARTRAKKQLTKKIPRRVNLEIL